MGGYSLARLPQYSIWMFRCLHYLLSLAKLVQKATSYLHCGERPIWAFPTYAGCMNFRSASACSGHLHLSRTFPSVAPLVATSAAACRLVEATPPAGASLLRPRAAASGAPPSRPHRPPEPRTGVEREGAPPREEGPGEGARRRRAAEDFAPPPADQRAAPAPVRAALQATASAWAGRRAPPRRIEGGKGRGGAPQAPGRLTGRAPGLLRAAELESRRPRCAARRSSCRIWPPRKL